MLSGQNAQAVCANLVRRITIDRDSVGSSYHGINLFLLHKPASHIVTNDHHLDTRLLHRRQDRPAEGEGIARARGGGQEAQGRVLFLTERP